MLAGSAGQGVTTTLAALSQGLLYAKPLSVTTIEAPIEYILTPGQGVVQQLHVGNHVNSVEEGLVRARSNGQRLADAQCPR